MTILNGTFAENYLNLGNTESFFEYHATGNHESH